MLLRYNCKHVSVGPSPTPVVVNDLTNRSCSLSAKSWHLLAIFWRKLIFLLVLAALQPPMCCSNTTANTFQWVCPRPRCRSCVDVLHTARVCGTWRPLLLGTCPCAVVVAGGVLLWRASWSRPLHRASSGPVALGAPVGFRDAMVPFPNPGAVAPALLGGCAGHAEAGREPRSLCLPLAPAEAGAPGSLHVVPVRGPALGLSLAGPSGVGLGLRALRWLACVDPVTGASGLPYGPSCDRGTSRCTGAVWCGRPHLPLQVRGRPARVCARFS